ncbi:hypothetical protein [Streptomyces sp. NPDC018031]|uniref:hypothetical protein n=1 Tax=Streptomyces sp. NPDC018031 TaxID=3365033 RepID=UPI00378AEBD0
MDGLVFELEHYVAPPCPGDDKIARPHDEPSKSGFRGTVEGLGEVVVEHEGVGRRDGGPQRTRVEVRGAAVPAVVLTGRAVWGDLPSLDQAELTVDGVAVPLKLNLLGAKKTQRALRFAHRNRSYTYSLLPKGRREGAELRRDQVCVRMEYFKNRKGLRTTRGTRGTISGTADALDVALAVLFEQVDTNLLSLAGAAATAPFHLMDRMIRPSQWPGQ